MSTKDDGGPAFPQALAVSPSGDVLPHPHGYDCGMSLRDWFAGMALQALAANYNGYESEQTYRCVFSAYVFADAMIAYRKER